MPTREQPTIVLVEDSADDELLTMRALKLSRIRNSLVVVRDGAEAIEYLLDDSRPPPQLVLLDLNLPKLDGLDVLKRLRSEERTRLLPIVVLTSSNETTDILRSYQLGANSYIRKPVDFDQFARAIRELGLYWLVINEPPPPGAGAAL
jgi:two-component system, response regulator